MICPNCGLKASENIEQSQGCDEVPKNLEGKALWIEKEAQTEDRIDKLNRKGKVKKSNMDNKYGRQKTIPIREIGNTEKVRFEKAKSRKSAKIKKANTGKANMEKCQMPRLNLNGSMNYPYLQVAVWILHFCNSLEHKRNGTWQNILHTMFV